MTIIAIYNEQGENVFQAFSRLPAEDAKNIAAVLRLLVSGSKMAVQLCRDGSGACERAYFTDDNSAWVEHNYMEGRND